jgi:hypothetical protein
MSPEMKAKIDAMSLDEMLTLNRFAPIGHPIFLWDTGEYFLQRMNKLREADPAGWVAASKAAGRDDV